MIEILSSLIDLTSLRELVAFVRLTYEGGFCDIVEFRKGFIGLEGKARKPLTTSVRLSEQSKSNHHSL